MDQMKNTHQIILPTVKQADVQEYLIQVANRLNELITAVKELDARLQAVESKSARRS